MPRFSKRASNIRGRLEIDPKSIAQFDTTLAKLAKAVREEVIKRALQSGGEVIEAAAESKAPGPHIVTVVMTGAELMKGWKSSAAQGIKSTGFYGVVGPDEDHWYYRFSEYGVKPHGVTKRKRTRSKQYMKKHNMSREQGASMLGKRRMSRNARPTMRIFFGGKEVFARKVQGYAAKPFLRPAVDAAGSAALNRMADTIGSEIQKAL
jgi:HK97 gp10 family phage protein